MLQAPPTMNRWLYRLMLALRAEPAAVLQLTLTGLPQEGHWGPLYHVSVAILGRRQPAGSATSGLRGRRRCPSTTASAMAVSLRLVLRAWVRSISKARPSSIA